MKSLKLLCTTLLVTLPIMGGSFDYRGNTTPVAEWSPTLTVR